MGMSGLVGHDCLWGGGSMSLIYVIVYCLFCMWVPACVLVLVGVLCAYTHICRCVVCCVCVYR